MNSGNTDSNKNDTGNEGSGAENHETDGGGSNAGDSKTPIKDKDSVTSSEITAE